jgi:hypothetical protein
MVEAEQEQVAGSGIGDVRRGNTEAKENRLLHFMNPDAGDRHFDGLIIRGQERCRSEQIRVRGLPKVKLCQGLPWLSVT